MKKSLVSIGLTIICTWLTLFLAELVAVQLSRFIEGSGIFYWFVVVAVVSLGCVTLGFGLISK